MNILKHRLMAAEGGAEVGGAAPAGTVAPEGTPAGASPNADWKNDKGLDANGNPVTEPVVATPEVEAKPETSDAGDDKPTDKIEESAVQFDFKSPIVQQIETLVKDAGLDPADVAKAVTESKGEVSPALMKSLVEKHGEAVAALIANNLKTFHDANVAQANKRDTGIYDEVAEQLKGVTEQSGKESWNELATWAKTNIGNTERSEINDMLAKGGLSAKAAIKEITTRFLEANKVPATQEAELMGGDHVPTANVGAPLSKSDYSREMRTLTEKGHIYGASSEMEALDNRRLAGRARGM